MKFKIILLTLLFISSFGFTQNTSKNTLKTTHKYQKISAGIPTISLSADNNAGSILTTEIKYINGTTLGLDPGFDAGQFGGTGPGNFNLYTRLVQNDSGVNFALQVVPDTDYDNTVIPIGLDANIGTQITFKANATDLPAGRKVYIEDRLLNIFTEINNTDKSYDLTLASTISGIGRFYIHTLNSLTLTFDVDGLWSNPASWSPAQIPTSIDNVTIPNGKTITVNASGAVANYLTIETGGVLNIAAGANLTVDGFTQNGTVTINSDASNNGSFIVSGGGGTGIVTYQRFLKGGQWHLITAPVHNSQTISSFIAEYNTDMTTDGGVKYSLAPYDNSFVADGSSTWQHYTSDGSNPAPATSFTGGYQIKYDVDKTVHFTGQVGYYGIGAAITVNTTGWNLIGNPFTSSLYGNVSADATNNFLTVNAAQLDPSFVVMYIWNPTNGSYDIINQASGARYLAPGQAFFVKAAVASTVAFNANHQTHQTTNNFQKSATTSIPTITLTADNKSGTVSSTNIKYMNGTTLGLDPGYDAGQFGATGAGNFNLYTQLVQDNGVNFGLQVVPDTNYETTVIPIGVDANIGTQLTFKATATDLPIDKKVFLEDKLLNSFTEINNTDKSYTVTLPSNLSGTGRFYLHTRSSTLDIDDYSVLESQYTLVTSPEQNNIRLYGAVTEKGSVNIYDTFGRQIHNTTLQKGSEQNIKVPVLSTGVYILKFNIDNKPFSKKIMWY